MEYAAKAMPDGIICGDHKLRAIKLLDEDHGSAGSVSAQAAAKLISEARVDLLMCSAAANVVNAAAAEAEARECPFIADFVPWQSFLLDRGGSPDKPFKWTYAHAFGLEDVADVFVRCGASSRPTRTSGCSLPTTSTARMDGTLRPSSRGHHAGYEAVTGALRRAGGDFTLIIELKKHGCEICAGRIHHRLSHLLEQARRGDSSPRS